MVLIECKLLVLKCSDSWRRRSLPRARRREHIFRGCLAASGAVPLAPPAERAA